MKSNLTKVSFALLSAVFILSCQDVGTGVVEADGLSPQFAKKDKNCVTPPLHPSCPEDEVPPPAGTTFDVTILSSQISSPDPQPTTALNLYFENYHMDLSFFNNGPTNCSSLAVQPGTLIMTRGDADGPHVHVTFQFEYHETSGVDSKHSLSIEGVPDDLGVDWGDPTETRVVNSYASGYWTMTSKGRNHQNGCKGEEDGTLNTGDEVNYTIIVAPLD